MGTLKPVSYILSGSKMFCGFRECGCLCIDLIGLVSFMGVVIYIEYLVGGWVDSVSYILRGSKMFK